MTDILEGLSFEDIIKNNELSEKDINVVKVYPDVCHKPVETKSELLVEQTRANQHMGVVTNQFSNNTKLIHHEYIGQYILVLGISEIEVPARKREVPSIDKLEEIEKHFSKNGQIDKPIIVRRENGQYVIDQGYDRYFFAKEKHLEYIPAMLDGEHSSHRYWLCKVGRNVRHKVLGDGVVVDFSLEKIVVRFDNKDRILMLDDCVKKGLLM